METKSVVGCLPSPILQSEDIQQYFPIIVFEIFVSLPMMVKSPKVQSTIVVLFPILLYEPKVQFLIVDRKPIFKYLSLNLFSNLEL